MLVFFGVSISISGNEAAQRVEEKNKQEQATLVAKAAQEKNDAQKLLSSSRSAIVDEIKIKI
ncbi:MAG: hypothetical protein ACT4P0_09165 [Panacagrimonas sp.]